MIEKAILFSLYNFIRPLPMDLKKAILAWLNGHVSGENSPQFVDKKNILSSLNGSWADTSDDLSDEILLSRSLGRPLDLEI